MNIIQKIVLKIAIKKILNIKGVQGMFEKIKKLLEGKKSYVVIVFMMLLGAAQIFLPIQVPSDIWVALLGLLGISYKAGQNRVENATKELIEAIREQNKLLK